MSFVRLLKVFGFHFLLQLDSYEKIVGNLRSLKVNAIMELSPLLTVLKKNDQTTMIYEQDFKS